MIRVPHGVLVGLMLCQCLPLRAAPPSSTLDAIAPTPSYEASSQAERRAAIETSSPLRVYSHPAEVLALAFSPRGTILATGDERGTLRLWPLGAEELVKTLLAHKKGIRALSFAPDGALLASGGGDGLVHVWDAESGRLQSWLDTRHRGAVISLTFTPEGHTLLSGSSDDTVNHRDVITGNRLVSYFGHSADVMGVLAPPGGACVISGGEDRSLQGWNIISGEQVDFSTQPRRVTALALAPDGGRLASGQQDGVIALRRTQGCQVHTIAFRLTGHNQTIRTLTFSPDGQWLFSAGDDKRILRWDVERGIPIEVYLGHQDRVTSLSVSPDGALLASSSRDGTVRLWRLKPQTPFDRPGTEIQTGRPPRPPVPSSAGEPQAQVPLPGPGIPSEASRGQSGPSPD